VKSTVSFASRVKGYASAVGEAGVGALSVAGKVVGLLGAHAEAKRSYELEIEHGRGRLNATLMYGATFAGAELATAVDDVMGAFSGGILVPVIADQYEQTGSGPTQNVVGEAIRGFLGWSFEHLE
jgi:hypothetical protein